ncbi:MAG TPA: hypothetical protein VKS43_12650 [Burkholderiales bacterium]|nr:hypothetical protein [Burkholderiales bacterium]
MKHSAILFLSAAFAFLAGAALAADQPEAVYAKYHRAVMSNDIDEMQKWVVAARRAELQGASASTRSAALTLAQYMVPRAYAVQRRIVNPNGRATLIATGGWDGGHRTLDTVYGTIKLMQENGEWKVDEAAWSDQKPEILLTPKPAPARAADKGAAKGAPAGSPASGPPGHKMGEAKPECVYKPVMTAEEMERCR